MTSPTRTVGRPSILEAVKTSAKDHEHEIQVRVVHPLRIKSLQHILTATQIALDILTVVVSFYMTFFLWSQWGPVIAGSDFQVVDLGEFSFSMGIGVIACLLGFGMNGLYQGRRGLLNIREFEVILKTCLLGCAITLAVLFLVKEPFFGRGIFVLTWCSIVGFMLVQRFLFYRFQARLRTAGILETVSLVYGADTLGQRLIGKLRSSPMLGYQIAGVIDDNPHLKGENVAGFPVLGGIDQLPEILRKTGAQKLFIAQPQIPQKVLAEVMQICRSCGCEFQVVPSLYDIVVQKVRLSEIDGIPIIGLSEPHYSWGQMAGKRLFDLVAGVLALFLLAPMMISLALLIKLSSRGPVFFLQKRVGRNGRKFLFYKFRSMRVDSPIYALTPSSGHDDRITLIGRLLRRFSLDELPQLINVIRGDMSLVGPRPEMPFIVSKYSDLQRQRLNVKPGITGLWQISPARRYAIHENMDYDIYYINHQSFFLDIAIMFRTAFSAVRGVGAC